MLLLIVGVSNPCSAQLLDLTTYTPAVVYYISATQDWKTSQPFFERGWMEENPQYTMSGKPFDTPVSYGVGMAQIRKSALMILVVSGAHNTGVVVAERLLLSRFPQRKKLIKGLGWAERIAFASVLTYQVSHQHRSQAARNKELRIALGW